MLIIEPTVEAHLGALHGASTQTFPPLWSVNLTVWTNNIDGSYIIHKGSELYLLKLDVEFYGIDTELFDPSIYES